MPNVPAFLSYVIVTTFTPGPNNIMSMSNSSRYGFKKSIFFNIGVFFGFFIIINLCNIFSMTLINLIPTIKPIMTFIGATYILWLAWKTFKSKPINDNNGTIKNHTNTFIYGLLLQFANPKVILYAITTVSTFIVPYYSSIFILLLFALFLSTMSFISTCCWALFGSIFQSFLAENVKIINIIMSLLLVYCAISLFF
ncbi:LysE family transporter [Sedimentibacter sp. MB31-C6]|uniref:LysE family transporter n=1 Tax=Sedimentibacter sp. MB31-C6 TaxID=3109366 RepID=UPI002DDD4E09|nr:LysE family transporter [Sedimentibacter sp. MB36-C1]WSI04843.1 LysE family transporter [Sedimentibacter sp. MB36-C1]